MNVDQRIRQELEDLGYQPEVVEGDTIGGHQRIVVFDYDVPVGRFRGSRLKVGISTQCEAVGYPEIPPHWIFISPPITDIRDGANHGLNNFGGRDWVALSRPPGEFWDRVANKTMRAYLLHLNKVWRQI